MNKASAALALLVMLAGAGAAVSASRSGGYLAPGELDVTRILEPAPRTGDARYMSDRTIFRATRRLIGTPRWQMATADADYSVPAMLHDFSCAVGVQLTRDNAPRLTAVVLRAGVDTGAQTGRAKEFYHRNRPFTIDQGKICQPVNDLYDRGQARMSYDYPSGHTTWGWTWALILSAIAPDRAQRIMERGRAYGDSRFICGAHNESAVEAGFLSATATMALVATKPAYQNDLAAARLELAALRAGKAPAADGCRAEASLVAQSVMPNAGGAAAAN